MHRRARPTLATLASLAALLGLPARAQAEGVTIAFADRAETAVYTRSPSATIAVRVTGPRRASSLIVTVTRLSADAKTAYPMGTIGLKPGATSATVRLAPPLASDAAVRLQAVASIAGRVYRSNTLRATYWSRPTEIRQADWTLDDTLETATVAVWLRNLVDPKRSGPAWLGVRDPLTGLAVPASVSTNPDGSGGLLKLRLADLAASAQSLEVVARGTDLAGQPFVHALRVAVGRSLLRRFPLPEAPPDTLDVPAGPALFRLTRLRDAYLGETLAVSVAVEGRLVPLGAPFNLPAREFGFCPSPRAYVSGRPFNALLAPGVGGVGPTLIACDRQGNAFTLRLSGQRWQVVASGKAEAFSGMHLFAPELMAAGGRLWRLGPDGWRALDPPEPILNPGEQDNGLTDLASGSLYRAAGPAGEALLAAVVRGGQVQVQALEGEAWKSLGGPLSLDSGLSEVPVDVARDARGTVYLVTRKRLAGARPLFVYRAEGGSWRALPDGLAADGAYVQTVFDERGTPLVAVSDDRVIAVSSPTGDGWSHLALIDCGRVKDGYGANTGRLTVLPGGRLNYTGRDVFAVPSAIVSVTLVLPR